MGERGRDRCRGVEGVARCSDRRPMLGPLLGPYRVRLGDVGELRGRAHAEGYPRRPRLVTWTAELVARAWPYAPVTTIVQVIEWPLSLVLSV